MTYQKTDNASDWESSDEYYDSDRDPGFTPSLCVRLRDARKRCGQHVQTEILVCYDQCIEDIESCDQHGEVLKALKRKKS